MTIRTVSRLAATAAAGCVVLGLAAELPAHAAPGAGTWTRVTTPSARTAVLSHVGHAGNLTVAGQASNDVSTVNVVCLRGIGSEVISTSVATAVAVTAGRFQVTVPLPDSGSLPTCRLRALPSGVSVQTTYLASYAGPVMDLDQWQYDGPTGHEFDYLISAGKGTGETAVGSFNSCSVSRIVATQPDLSVPGGSHGCLAYVGANAGGNAMLIRVDGHPVYATREAALFHVPGAGPVRVSVHTTPSGTTTWRQTDDLLQCAQDTFPPVSGSCDTAASSGVSLRRVGTFGAADGHQVRLQDAFVSTDGKKHRVQVTYQSSYLPPTTGASGLRIPGHGHTFTLPAAGAVVGGLPTGAASVLIRSNTYADEGDPTASTWALTWSRTVPQLRFDASDRSVFGTPLTLRVARRGSAMLRFVASQAVTTARAAALAAGAEKAMMPAPRITSPHPGGVVAGRSTTVKGVVRMGANGLPSSVKVNGHPATLKPNKAGTSARFSVTFSESLGAHVLTVVATDAGGNRRTASLRVRNR